jgi:predicted DCC family thiol-disulfide oxidoreductase YuxK
MSLEALGPRPMGALMALPDAPVVLYDGACGLCDRLVQFVLPRDPQGRFRFAALQSERGRGALGSAGLPTDDFDTMVLIEDGTVHVRSTAALRVVRRLRFPWPLLYALIAVPRPLRDALYRWVARNRERLLPPPVACSLPDARWSERFLD